jgi:hypothetical protein
MYVVCVAPLMGVQRRPFALQRSHEYVYAVGAEVQTPFETSRIWPTLAVPESVGWVVDVSGDAAGATGPTRFA